MKRKISIIFLVLVLIASAFLMCGPAQYKLEINKNGNGNVTAEPNFPDGTYTNGTDVVLKAVADSGWFFVEWQGDLSGGVETKTITIDSDKSVTAIFKENNSNDLKDIMISVPGGRFTQSSEDESFAHRISDFSIGKYEVTYALWYTVYTWAKENSYNFQNAGREGDDGTDGANPTDDSKYEPVTCINW